MSVATLRKSFSDWFEFAQDRHARYFHCAGWSSLVARQAHNLKVAGSNPAPATKSLAGRRRLRQFHALDRA
jgi:hypothetical protein